MTTTYVSVCDQIGINVIIGIFKEKKYVHCVILQ